MALRRGRAMNIGRVLLAVIGFGAWLMRRAHDELNALAVLLVALALPRSEVD